MSLLDRLREIPIGQSIILRDSTHDCIRSSCCKIKRLEGKVFSTHKTYEGIKVVRVG